MNVYTIYESPIGSLLIQANDDGLLGAWFETHTTKPDNVGIENDNHPVLQLAVTQLKEYFSGHRQQFTLPIAVIGTLFQQRVWAALCTIPYGETWSYQQLANAIDNPKAVRAVGLANGKNPLSIIIPCHRVIGKDGKLTGYAGGIERKAALLKKESKVLQSH